MENGVLLIGLLSRELNRGSPEVTGLGASRTELIRSSSIGRRLRVSPVHDDGWVALRFCIKTQIQRFSVLEGMQI